MKDLIVVMGNSTGEMRGTMALYHSQLEAAGIDYHVEPIPPPNCSIGWKLGYFRQMCQKFSDYKFIVFTDAFDVQFFGSKIAAILKIPRYGILLAAEKNCHPYKEIMPRIPDVGPWRYANGGCQAGTVSNILLWCDDLEKHPLYHPDKVDQGFFNELVAEGSELGQIDYRTGLFFCLFDGYPELEFASRQPFNLRYATYPQFVHANGCSSTQRLDYLKARAW